MRHTRHGMPHFVPNSCAAGTLRTAKPDATVYSGCDPLSCGRARAFDLDSIDEWFSERAKFWATVYGPEFESCWLAEMQLGDVLAPFRSGAAKECVLWVGNTAEDILFCAWFCNVARLFGDCAISVVDCSQLRPGKRTFPFTSAAVCNVDDFKNAPPPVRLSAAERRLYCDAWNVWVSATPDVFTGFVSRHQDTPIGDALSSLLYRYPLAGYGINQAELWLLDNLLKEGPRIVRAIGWTLGDGMDSADWIGDGWLFWRARRLADASLKQPLLELSDPWNMTKCEARLTEAGHAVLERRMDARAVNGIEDWVGGVNVSSSNNAVWLNSDGTLVRA